MAGPAADGGHLGPCMAIGARFPLAGKLLFAWEFGEIEFVSSFSVGPPPGVETSLDAAR